MKFFKKKTRKLNFLWILKIHKKFTKKLKFLLKLKIFHHHFVMGCFAHFLRLNHASFNIFSLSLPHAPVWIIFVCACLHHLIKGKWQRKCLLSLFFEFLSFSQIAMNLFNVGWIEIRLWSFSFYAYILFVVWKFLNVINWYKIFKVKTF